MSAFRTPAPPQALAIHIDVVTLEGITMTPAQARQFRGALQAELQRIATLQRWPRDRSSAMLAAQRAPQVVLQTPDRAAQLGVEIGRSLWAAIRVAP